MTTRTQMQLIASLSRLMSRRRGATSVAPKTTQSILLQAWGCSPSSCRAPLSSVRYFSSSPPKDNTQEPKTAELKEGNDSGVMDRARKSVLSTIVTPQNQFYGLIAGGTFGAYLISRGFLSLTNFFTHLNPTLVAKYGFYTGFSAASVLGGLLAITMDNLYIRADPVFQYCRNWVVNDARVEHSLGDGLKTGDLRSYRLDSGRFEMKGQRPIWRPPRIQMLFDVTATGPPYRTGLVTCEAVKREGFPPKLETTLLMVDYETGSTDSNETLFLQGTEEQLLRVSSRSGLSLAKLASRVEINEK